MAAIFSPLIFYKLNMLPEPSLAFISSLTMGIASLILTYCFLTNSFRKLYEEKPV